MALRGLQFRWSSLRAPIRYKTRIMQNDFRTPSADAGFGLVSLLASLAVLGILAVVTISALNRSDKTLPSGTPGAGSDARLPTLSTPDRIITTAADDVVQSNLRVALEFADEMSAEDGGYGAIDIKTLSKISPAEAFTSGASTHATQVSVASVGGDDGGVTLAAHAASATCWLVWQSSTTTIYGVERNRPSCVAPPLAKPPTLGKQPGGLDWKSSSFPSS